MACVMEQCDCLFFFQAEDGIRDIGVTGVQTCALPICMRLPQLGDVLPPLIRSAVPRKEVAELPQIADGDLISTSLGLRDLGLGKLLPDRRSEERRVGKECRSRWSPYH